MESAHQSPSSSGLRLRPIRIKSATVPTTGDGISNGSSQEYEEEPMTPAGRVFSDPVFNCHILVIFGMKHPVQLETVRLELQNTLLKHKRFCSVVKVDKRRKPYWVRTQVNFDDHVIIPEIDPAQMHSGSFVEDYVAKLAQSPPLDVTRPLWELHILNAKLGEAQTNVVFRVHHSLGDGISLMSLFLACTRRVDKPDMLPTIPSQTRKVSGKSQDVDKSKSQRKNRFLLWKLLLMVWKLLLILWYTSVDVYNFLATSLWMDDSTTPIKGLPGVEFQAKHLVHATVDLKDIQLVKRASNGTVNDVLLGLVSAGLLRYLQYCYDNKSQEHRGENLDSDRKTEQYSSSKSYMGLQSKGALSNLQIRASTLMNTRPSPGLQELQSMMDTSSHARWGNHMGYLILPIPLAEHEDPLEYVSMAKAISDKKKLSLEAVFTYVSGTLLMKLAGSKVAAKLTYRCTSHTTLALSNVMGPLEQVQFVGNPIMHIIPTVYGQPQSLCLHFQSYMGKMKIIIFAARDLIPDPEKLCYFMTCALQEMKQRAVTLMVEN